jgi:hypothetical protein
MLTPQNFGAYNVSSIMGIGLFRNGEPHPYMYLAFAEEDLAQTDAPRTRVNALANAKRALHLQIEALTDALGFARWSEKTLGGFPRRTHFLEECGLITPRIIAKINRLRNEVEHEYVVPERDLVEDYVEVVGLYLGSSDKIVRSFPHMRELCIGTGQTEQMYSLCMKRASGILRLYECDNMTLIHAWPEADVAQPRDPPDAQVPRGIVPIVTVDMASDESIYFEWVRILLGTWK